MRGKKAKEIRRAVQRLAQAQQPASRPARGQRLMVWLRNPEYILRRAFYRLCHLRQDERSQWAWDPVKNCYRLRLRPRRYARGQEKRLARIVKRRYKNASRRV